MVERLHVRALDFALFFERSQDLNRRDVVAMGVARSAGSRPACRLRTSIPSARSTSAGERDGYSQLLSGPGVAAGRRFQQRQGLARDAADASRLSVLRHLRQGGHGRRSGVGPGGRSSSSTTSRRPAPSLSARGADVSEVFHFDGPLHVDGTKGRAPGKDPEGQSYRSWASFSDPDGNSWMLQEIKTRLPGRGESNLDVATLTELLQQAEKGHGAYEATAPKHHWSGWYAAYIVALTQGKTPEEAAKRGRRSTWRARGAERRAARRRAVFPV